MRPGAREALWNKVVEKIQKALPSAPDPAPDVLFSTITTSEPLNQNLEYDQSFYEYDRAKVICRAGLGEGALLYRMVSVSHSNKGDLISGVRSLFYMAPGRFNRIQQRTTYCSNNILISIAETLFSMHRRMLDAITNRQPVAHIKTLSSAERCLVAFRVHEIDDLVYAEAEEASLLFGPMTKAVLVHPEPVVGQLLDFSDNVRKNANRGILYPSPRHSKGLCIALFQDETHRVRSDVYERLYVNLQLLAEDQETIQSAKGLNPLKDIPDSTRGHYSFRDSTQFEELQKAGLIFPYGLPSSGAVDLVRQSYQNYPKDAVRTILKPAKTSIECPLSLESCPNHLK